MPIHVHKVENRRSFQAFISLPHKLHASEENWMPTLIADDKAYFDPKSNHQFDACDTLMALAYDEGGNIVGRIMGIIHHTYNAIRQERKARFGYFDAINSQEVAHALICFVEQWAKEKGADTLIGPYGFSDKDVQGLLIDGFDKKPLIDSACNPPYIVKLIERENFLKEVDCYTYKFGVDIQFPDLYHKIYERALLQQDIQLLHFKSRGALKKYITPVLELVNRTYDHLYGFVPMTDTEIEELGKRYLPILDPRFVKVITKANHVVAFIVGIPNLTKGIQRTGGKLFPLGIFKLLWEIHKSKQVDLMLGAVDRSLQGHGLEVVLGLSLIEACKKAGMQDIETHLILETNVKMRAEMERLNIPIYKRFRVYQKKIT